MQPDMQRPEATNPLVANAGTNDVPLANTVWSKNVPAVNRNSIKICLGFLLTVDLYLVATNPGLIIFYLLMLVAFVVLVVFTGFESTLSKKLGTSPSLWRDNTLLTLIYFRNIILIANVIPLIQLLGMLGAVYLGPVIIIVYGCVLVSCLNRTPL